MRKIAMTLCTAAMTLIGGVTSAFAATSNTVTVQPGNTFWNLSQSLGVSMQSLEQANPSINPSNLLVGTVLQLPSTATAAPTASTSSSASQNLYWLEHVINAEAGGQSFQAQIAVGDVIVNRMNAGGYGNTVKSVVFQVLDGHYQFTSVANGYIYTAPNASSVRAAQDVLNQNDNIVPGALVFYNSSQTPAGSWVRTQPFITQIDSLVFAK